MNAFLADAIVVVHFAIVLFMIGGLLLILLGGPLRWAWVRNRWFRLVHLAIMGYIAMNALRGELCFLTHWESAMRNRAGQPTDDVSFVGRLVHDLLFVEGVEQETLHQIYFAFGALVLASIVLVRPVLRPKRHAD